MSVDNCENCGRPIGKLEQPYVWRKHVVCAECHVHLSAPAPTTAATAPAHAGPSIAGRRHFHVPAAPSHGGGRTAPPIAVAPEAPKASAPPMLLCTACGRACAFDEVVSDHGRVTCRVCARAAAAEKAARVADEARRSVIRKVCVGAAAVMALAVVAGGMYVALRTKATTVATNTTAPATTQPPAAASGAQADASTARAAETPAAPKRHATGRGAVEAPTQNRKELFPVPPVPDSAPAVAQAAQADALPPAAATVMQAPPSQAIRAPIADSATANPAIAPVVDAPAAAPAKPPPEGTADWFAYKGKELLAQGKFQPALLQFAEATKKDRNHADACHGAGLCYQGLGNRDLAIERLEKAVTLYNPPSRTAVYNLAALLLKDNAMRAARVVSDYLKRDGVPPDEPLHTLMGRAVFSVTSRTARQNAFYGEMEQFYFTYNETLDSARADGRKRWGSEWVPGGQATAKWDRWRTRRANVERLRSETDQADKRKDAAFGKLDDIKRGMRLYTEQEKRTALRRYEEAARAEIAIRHQLKAAETEFNSTEKPPFPQIVRTIAMDAVPPGTSPGMTR